jgi:3-methylcrotonyl-CoA carboxylase alpha subunit
VFSQYGLGFEIVDPLDRAAARGGDTDLIEAPMPGLVKAVFVEPGQQVRAGQRLAILEAMKMEHTLGAPRDGRIGEVLVAEGSQIEAGVVMIVLEEEE